MNRFSLNPVLLKELRQSVRSRIISTAIYGLFLIQLLVYGILFACDSNQASNDHPLGNTTFATSAIILCVLTFILYPFSAFVRLHTEHSKESHDLTFTAPLSPRQIIDGKIADGLIMTALLIATTFPFILLSYQLHGISLSTILTFLLYLFPIAGTLITFSLLLSLIKTHFILVRLFYTIVLFGAVMPLTFTLWGVFFFDHSVPEGHPLFFSILGILSIGFLLRALAITAISPPSTNYARPFRHTLLRLWLFWFLLLTGFYYYTHNSDYPILILLLGLLASTLCLLHALVMRSNLNRRTCLEIRPRFRLLQFLTYSSAEGGLILSLLLPIPSILCFHYLFDATQALNEWSAILPPFFYFSTFVLFIRALAAYLPFQFFKKPFVRFCLVLTIPLAWSLFTTIPGDGDYIPGNLFATLSEEDSTSFHLSISAFAYCICFLAYLPVVFRTLRAFHHPTQTT